MQKVLNEIKDQRLKAYIIWLPMLPGDNREQAQKRSNEFSDSRLTYFWDGEQVTGKAWQAVLRIPRVAWDVYFLYNADVHWQENPTRPDFWMHQLAGVASAPLLKEETFAAKIQELLKNMHEKADTKP